MLDEISKILDEKDKKKKTVKKKPKKLNKKMLEILEIANHTVLPNYYKTVWTMEDLQELCNWLERQEYLAVDTETMGLEWWKDEIVGISFYAPHQGYYIPLKHKDHVEEGVGEVGIDYVKCLPIEIVSQKLKPILEDSSKKLLFHNWKFDYHILRAWMGIKTRCYFDTMVAQALLDETQSKALKDMATHYLKIPADKFSTLFGKEKFNTIPILMNTITRTGNLASYYAIKDTELTYKMFEFQIKHLENPKLEKLYNLMFNIEMPFLHIVAEAEERGIKVDKDYLVNEVAPKLHAELDQLKEIISSYIGDINIKSTQQLSKALYEDLKLPRINKKSPNSTDRKTLNKLKKMHPIIPAILEYRTKSKLCDAFADTLPTKVFNGRIYTSFNTVGAKTGRMSSANPNLQQMPSSSNLIRNAFMADEGRLLASIDFGSQELRLLTEVSGDTVMLDIFTNDGDVHSTTAVTIWNNKYPDKPTDIDTFQRLRKVSDAFRDKDGNIDNKKLNDSMYLQQLFEEGIITTYDVDILVNETELGLEYEKMRKKAKQVNFSIVYGTTEIGLSDGLEISEDEAIMYIQSYMQTYPGVAKWIEDTKRIIRKQAYVETLLGRKRRLYSEVRSGKPWLLESAYRMGCNSQIQGSAADQTKLVSIKLQPLLKELDSRIVLWVHDEIIFDVPENIGMSNLQRIADVMSNALPLKCGMKCDIEVGRRWSQKMSEDDINELMEEEYDG